MKVHKNHWWTLLFVGLGYLGAAIFYSYLVGINANRQIFCLVCPDITSSGPPVPKFIHRTLVFGTLHAVFMLLIGWSIIFLVRLIRRASSK